ncbi:hypothetical protein DFH06DRAFT_1338369 [Mycena polygramma]|nr:hypothetical protein DFH06DRAFT_1338369 [Mycena polygramma]
MGNLLSTPGPDIPVAPPPLSPGDILRDIYVVSRPLGNGEHAEAVLKQGPPPPMFHWAVRVGNSVYELDKGGGGEVIFQQASSTQRQWSTEYHIGGTILTDEQLSLQGECVLAGMWRVYNALVNNCQHFVRKFVVNIAHGKIDRTKLEVLKTIEDTVNDAAILTLP